jgi:poly-gamma-glutamate synthesis protein (capsule biosynthesis protein)
MKKTIHKVLLIHIPLFLLIGLFHIKLLIIDKTLDPKLSNTDILINVDNIINDWINSQNNTKFIETDLDENNTSTWEVIISKDIPDEIVYKKDIDIAFLWDVMIGSRVWEAMDKQWQDYVYWWTKDYLFQKNAVILNLETTVTNREDKINKTYTFKAKNEHLEWLKQFNDNLVVNLANNHIWDYKSEWVIDTINNLKNSNIEYFWAWINKIEADAVKIITVEWVKIALIWQTCINPISFWATEIKAGNSRFDKDIILQEIKKSQENNADIIVYNMHCWVEYTNGPNQTQKEYAHFAIDSWADLVIWHHPHRYQPVEIYNNKLIFYSLGDYIFDIFRGRRTQEGIIANIKISDKKIIWAEIIPTYTEGYWNTILSETKRKEFALNELYEISMKLWKIEWIKTGYIDFKKKEDN